jgi:xanthine dehydrogenase accessory factor
VVEVIALLGEHGEDGRVLADGRARLIRVSPAGDLIEEAGIEGFKSMCPTGGTVEVFIDPMLPRPALLIAGASLVARALCDLAKRLGYAVSVAALADDLETFAECDRKIEGFKLSEEGIPQTGFIVVATQGKRDREALREAVATTAPYIAFIGSRKKAKILKDELIENGVDAAAVGRVRSPAGIDIGAVTPEEIALSVLADIVRERRQGSPAEAPRIEDVLEEISGEAPSPS